MAPFAQPLTGINVKQIDPTHFQIFVRNRDGRWHPHADLGPLTEHEAVSALREHGVDAARAQQFVAMARERGRVSASPGSADSR